MRWPMVAIFLLLFLFLFRGMEVSAQPKPEGTLNIALANLAEEGFLADLGDPEQGRVWPFVYEYPFYLNKDRKLMPGLAEKFEYSKDGLTLTLFLRKGVIWQGGWGEVTADDVKYTYDRLSRSSTSMVASILRAAVKNIDIIDRTVVAFRLKKPSPEVWGDIFGAANAAAPIMCKKYIESVGDEKARFQPIGSGPYRLVERRAGEYLKFQASEKHWRVVPEFKDVMVHLVPEETTRVAMLKTGKIDIAPISAQTVADLRNTADVTAIAFWGVLVECIRRPIIASKRGTTAQTRG